MACGFIIFSSKRSERALRVYQQRADFMSRISDDAQVRLNADSLLNYWRGDDMDDRAFQTWEAEQLRKGRQKLTRSMKLGVFQCPSQILKRQYLCHQLSKRESGWL